MDPNEHSVTHLAATVADALGEQVELHVELAKAEFRRDLRAMARDAMPLALGLPMIVVGYGLGNMAVARLVEPWLGPWLGLGGMGLINMVLGVAAAHGAIQALLSRHLYRGTLGQETKKTARSLLAGLVAGPREVNRASG
jgi:hypothetical protein